MTTHRIVSFIKCIHQHYIWINYITINLRPLIGCNIFAKYHSHGRCGYHMHLPKVVGARHFHLKTKCANTEIFDITQQYLFCQSPKQALHILLDVTRKFLWNMPPWWWRQQVCWKCYTSTRQHHIPQDVFNKSMVTQETRNQMTVKSQAGLWPMSVSQLQGYV